jgi:hypothetical protein
MVMMTQEKLQALWQTYVARLDNDGDSDVLRADYDEEVSRQGGILVRGLGGMDHLSAKDLVETLKERGCAVLDDPAREGEDAALVIFLPETVNSKPTNAAKGAAKRGESWESPGLPIADPMWNAGSRRRHRRTQNGNAQTGPASCMDS